MIFNHSTGQSQDTNSADHKTTNRAFNRPITLAEWEDRELPMPDFLLGQWLTTTSRVLIVGPTGLGKTNFGLALAFNVAAGKDFLHWKAVRQSRVLYIDGEMPRRLMKERLLDAGRRANVKPDGLFVLSREDVDLPPLNSEEGYRFMLDLIDSRGPFDLIVFDNIQALLIGDMTTEEQWAKVLPLVRGLSKRSIGQLWFHHTGHDEKKSYGSKAREWQMDTVILMKREGADQESDIEFGIQFTKARERTPRNRSDFDEVTISLRDDRWHSNRVEKMSKDTGDALRDLEALIRDQAEAGPCGDTMVLRDDWRVRSNVTWSARKPEARKKAFNRANDALAKRGTIVVNGNCVGLAKRQDKGTGGTLSLH
jgi:hypothetical protein